MATKVEPMVFGVFYKDGSEFTVNLHDYYPRQKKNNETIALDPGASPGSPVDLVGSKFFVMGASRGMQDGNHSPQQDPEPKFFFSSDGKIDAAAIDLAAFKTWFDVVVAGVQAFGKTKAAERSQSSERLAWAAGLQRFPFIRSVQLERGTPCELPVSYVKKSGSDVMIGKDLDFRVKAEVNPTGKVLMSSSSTCSVNCSTWPWCPSPDAH